MKKLVGLSSLLLWAAAVVIAPAPADAQACRASGVPPQYFSCGQSASIVPYSCTVFWTLSGGGTTYTFSSRLLVAYQGMCSGGCSGASNFDSTGPISPGRNARNGGYSNCAGYYVFGVQPCLNCAG